MKAYALVVLIQQKEVDYYCFGICKKLKVAGVDIGPAGPCFICCTQDCAYEAKSSTDPIGQAFGDDLYIRRLISIGT